MIRPANPGDAQRIAMLMHQLGYDVPAQELARRLQRQSKRCEIFVDDYEGEVRGWVGVSADETFVEGLRAQLEGLVVDESSRSCGIGKALLGAAESWARQHGCREMLIRSNVLRTDAHRFYRREGYATFKTQYNLRKRLSNS